MRANRGLLRRLWALVCNPPAVNPPGVGSRTPAQEFIVWFWGMITTLVPCALWVALILLVGMCTVKMGD